MWQDRAIASLASQFAVLRDSWRSPPTLGELSAQFVTSQRADFQRLLQHTLKSGTTKMTFYWDCWEVHQSIGSGNFAQDLRGLQLSDVIISQCIQTKVHSAPDTEAFYHSVYNLPGLCRAELEEDAKEDVCAENPPASNMVKRLKSKPGART